MKKAVPELLRHHLLLLFAQLGRRLKGESPKGKAPESRRTPGLLYLVIQSDSAREIKKFVQKFLQFLDLAMDGTR